MTPTDTIEAAPEIDMMKIAAEADARLDSTPEATAPDVTAAPATAPQETNGMPPEAGKDAPTTTDAKAPAAAKPTEDKAQPDAPKAPAKPETKFEKAKAEAERRDRSWKALEEEKAQVRAKAAAVETELQQVRREMEQLRAKPTGPAKDEHGATAEDYQALAKRYAAEGNDELAEAARARAEKLRQPAAAAATNGAATFDSPEFQSKWRATAQELIAKDPQLANPEHPLVKAANGILADRNYGRFFKSHPDGIVAAVEVARLLHSDANGKQATQRLAASEQELTKAKAEITRLNSLLQPRGSHPAGQPGRERKIEDLPAAEAHEAILAMARAADRGEDV